MYHSRASVVYMYFNCYIYFILFYVACSVIIVCRKNPYRAYVVFFIYSALNKYVISMSMSISRETLTVCQRSTFNDYDNLPVHMKMAIFVRKVTRKQ